MRRKIFILTSVMTLFLLFLIVVIGSLLTISWHLPQLLNKDSLVNARTSGVMLYDRNNNLIASFDDPVRRSVIPEAQIPESIKQAVVSMEDKEFYSHHGFSIKGITRAALHNIEQGTLSEGGSTITQQVIKNTILSPKKSFIRKYQELVLAAILEHLYDKDTILSMYLNTIYFGEGAYGIEEAAQTYFGTTANDLTTEESSYLAGLIAAPSSYNSESEGKKRQELVVQEMIKQGYISADQKQKILSSPLIFKNAHDASLGIAPHFSLYIYDQLKEKYGEDMLHDSGFKVITTLDSTMQTFAKSVVSNQVKSLRFRNVSNGATVVLDPKNGEILAMVGSHDWNDQVNGKMNMAVLPRQVGSSFKPIIYAAAFEKGILTPVTLLPDLPASYSTPEGMWKPHDYDYRYRGPVLPRRALANSLNLPAVAVMNKVGLTTGIQYAKSFGISTVKDPSTYGLSFVLGAAEIPLIDMTRAYAVFANDGKRPSITGIQKIINKYGKEEFSYHPQTETVIKESTAFLINSILSDQRTRSEVFGSMLNTAVKAAVKTGTTENYRDSLTIGYTPNLVIGVWVGNNDNRPMDTIAGSVGAAPIFRQLMNEFSSRRPNEEFSKPSSVTQKLVCVSDTLLPYESTPSAVKEYMIGGWGDSTSCKTEVAEVKS